MFSTLTSASLPHNKGDRYADFLKTNDMSDCMYYKSCTKSPSKCNHDCKRYTTYNKKDVK